MEKKRSGVLGFTAKVLNEAGGALVDIFDLGSGIVDKIGSKLKKAPDLGKKAREIVNEGIEAIKPDKTKAIKNKIKKKEEKIEDLYREIGKEGVKSSEEEGPLDTEPVKGLISDVKEYEKEIERLKGRITDLEEQKDIDVLEGLKPEERAEPVRGPEIVAEIKAQALPLKTAIEAAIDTALESGAFESAAEKAKFEKVGRDLLDDEIEIKILAVAELGKMGNKAAVPVLAESVKFEESHLSSEIVNALIDIGDSSAVGLFKERATDTHYRVRVACLRGLYKLGGDDEEAMRILINALQDEHPDVRKSGITFIGWKDNEEAVPALVQCLRDEDERVTKAALSALATIRDKSAVLPLIRVLRDRDFDMKERALDTIKMITGEEIVFDLQADGEELDSATDELVDWWQKMRLGEAGIEQAVEPEAEAVPEEIAGTVEPESETVAEEVEEEIEEAQEAAEEEVEETVESEVVAEEAEKGVEDAEEEFAEEEIEEEAVEKPEAEEMPGSEEELMKKLKSELIDICKDLGVECDEKLTKAEISQLIIENQI